jgi:vacuolar-type H+-ATPase subunit I/STV1
MEMETITISKQEFEDIKAELEETKEELEKLRAEKEEELPSVEEQLEMGLKDMREGKIMRLA